MPRVALIDRSEGAIKDLQQTDLIEIDTFSDIHNSARYFCFVQNVEKRRVFGIFINKNGHEAEFDEGLPLKEIKWINVRARGSNASAIFNFICNFTGTSI